MRFQIRKKLSEVLLSTATFERNFPVWTHLKCLSLVTRQIWFERLRDNDYDDATQAARQTRTSMTVRILRVWRQAAAIVDRMSAMAVTKKPVTDRMSATSRRSLAVLAPSKYSPEPTKYSSMLLYRPNSLRSSPINTPWNEHEPKNQAVEIWVWIDVINQSINQSIYSFIEHCKTAVNVQ